MHGTTGINYQLKVNGVNSGAAKPGTGSALTWGSNSGIGVYTIIGTDATTSCTVSMTGSAVINTLPAAFSISGGATISAGNPGLTISLSGSEIGVNYQLILNGANSGAVVQVQQVP